MATQSIQSIQSGYHEFLDPAKLARVAELKLRYSDTILKAQLTLSGCPDAQIRSILASKAKERSAAKKKLEVQEKRKGTPFLGVKKPQETKVVLRKGQHCAAEIKKLQEIRDKRVEALRRLEENELRLKREREAARVKINSLKKSVDLDNLGVMEELESLMGGPCVYHYDWLNQYDIRFLLS